MTAEFCLQSLNLRRAGDGRASVLLRCFGGYRCASLHSGGRVSTVSSGRKASGLLYLLHLGRDVCWFICCFLLTFLKKTVTQRLQLAVPSVLQSPES